MFLAIYSPQRSLPNNVKPDLSFLTTAETTAVHPKSTASSDSSLTNISGSIISEGPIGLNELPTRAMITSRSSPDVAATDTASLSAAAPYGTRSRGRNAAPRPNYAEDRDLDTDLELIASASKSSKRIGASSNNAAVTAKGDNEKAMSSHSRKSLVNSSGASSNSTSKDVIPGTSSFYAGPEETNGLSTGPRKRKQPSTANSSNGNGHFTKRVFTTPPGVVPGQRDSNMISFETHGPVLHDGKLTADDGTTYAVNDHVYLVCEPPGEPYYLARIMEFLPSKGRSSGSIEAIRVNWYYRPRDIQRIVTDTRLVFASMHSDKCPLAALRGKCQIRHTSEISDFDAYRKTRDCFWYDKMYDRYIHRYYDVIPTSKVINVPANVKKVLDERWKFVLVEVGRRKELTGAVKSCKRCGLYAASNDSVDCAVCHDTYHMCCVRPVLTKKPARGFAWACAACSRAQERKLEARQTPMIGESPVEVEEEIPEEDVEEPNGLSNGTGVSTPVPTEEETMPRPATKEQIAQAMMWPYRYLGVHCRVEDALDYDDRIYPIASSRLGTRHQANVIPWYGHPVEYVKPVEIKKRYLNKSNRKDSKLSKETQAAIEAEKQKRANRPKWIQDEPPGYVPRGEEEPVMVNGKLVRTAELLFQMPTSSQMLARGGEDAPGVDLTTEERERLIDEYMARAKKIASEKGLPEYSTNFIDKALEILYAESFKVEAALAKLKRMNKFSDIKEPHLRPEEVKLFEQGVAKYGSELRNVTKHVGTVPHWQIVRHYYMWKKTPKGRQIWGNYDGRRGKKEAKRASGTKLVDDLADDYDDSAFDGEKAAEKKRSFVCKFCSARSSRQWRRAPGVPPGMTVPSEPNKKEKGSQLTLALCIRCALLWRKYGIQWENVDEVAKKIAQSSSKSWRRRIDEELLAQLLVSTETPISISSTTAAAAASIGVTMNSNSQVQQESGKRKGRATDKGSAATSTATSVEPPAKKKPASEKVSEPAPLRPDPPRARALPCAICNNLESMGEELLSCRDCRLTVHRSCYGLGATQICSKWLCDMCSNDRNPAISTCYECVLCPVAWTEHELMEAPKSSNHRKKSEREREKERLEREMVVEAIKLYRQRQEAVGKPVGPREPLKRTTGNNWVHVLCAIFNPEIKFGNVEELEPAEGFGLIAADRYREVCKICKTNKGACVSCHYQSCNAHFHVGCAVKARYKLGFDITPVKSSRRDVISTVKLGEEFGAACAVVYCPDHAIQTQLHDISEATGQAGMNALQLYVQTYKQADLSVPGTLRRAAHMQQSSGIHLLGTSSTGHRKSSTANGIITGHAKEGNKSAATSTDEELIEFVADSDVRSVLQPCAVPGTEQHKKCYRCSTTFSPRWWSVYDNNRHARGSSGASIGNGAAAESVTPAPNGTPPFLGRNPPQKSLAILNGNFTPSEGNDSRSRQLISTVHECHKCHLKASSVQKSPDPQPSSYSAQRPVLPSPRILDYHGHPYGPPSHPNPPAVYPRPVGPHVHNSSGWSTGYEKPDNGDANLRSGAAAPTYHGPTPPPNVKGYASPHHVPPPPSSHSTQPYLTHPNSYGLTISAPSPHVSHAQGRPSYAATSVSPPVVHSTMVRHSPQRSISTPNGDPPQRVYNVDHVPSTSTRTPPTPQAQADLAPAQTAAKREGTPAGQPSGNSRHLEENRTNSAGARASPSLRNLLL